MNKNYKQIIIIYYCIIFYFQIVCAYYKKKPILTKDEVLKLTDAKPIKYYCKNNLCTYVEDYELFPFAIFLDENNKETSYIIETCTYDNAILGNCHNITKKLEGKYYSTICTENSNCLSERCVNGYCVFNDLNPVICCVTVYTPKFLSGEPESHMHCGKALHEPCHSSSECSSELCGTDGFCFFDPFIPSDSDGAITMPLLIIAILFIPIAIFIIICCCIIRWYRYKRIKTNTLCNS
ncbi:hypothetical protein H8356DRAFT_1717012 [Neocallimastix lanati (nom. inval.)]|uniref:Uncharacterized protein n=1 Tax=Neocallimastix californiae TaxID=1754190 RepID=A0A1Y2AJI0_9FUNG|nr:hypothetical protein H8356DRAFT_1717012 [Neocallimastix sp. JGI-2020a]ORY22095.1 hypothetical protein LY90DRAFT_134645 [Neocallimastix californiae]|eukprot:ORY22095.1 hypothetical protein LY90DRAFT_134645 [Neocallimastix californiae]